MPLESKDMPLIEDFTSVQQKKPSRATNNPCFFLGHYSQGILNYLNAARFKAPYLQGHFLLGQATRVFDWDGHGTDRIIKDAAKLAMAENNRNHMCQWRFGPNYALLMLNPKHIHKLLTENPTAYYNYDRTGSFELFFGKGTIFSLEEGTQEQKILRGKFLSTLFTDKALINAVAPMQSIVSSYMATIHTSQDNNRKFDITHLASCIAMDMIGLKLGLTNVSTSVKSNLLKMLHQGIQTVATHRGQTIQRFFPLLKYPPFNVFYQSTIEHIIKDAIAYMKKEILPNNETSILTTRNWLNPEGKLTRAELYQDKNVQRIIEFYVAGSETSATLLQFTVMLLADPKHQNVLNKLREEITAHSKDRPVETWGFEDIKSLPYADLVLQEALRLYPPIPDMVFEFSKAVDTEVGRLQKGDMVILSSRFTHRLPSVWGQDADAFRPERFEEPSYQNNPQKKFAYFPFGFEPRSCPGQRSAKLAMLFTLVRIVDEFDVRFEQADIEHPFEVHQQFTLRSGAANNTLCFEPRPKLTANEALEAAASI